MKYVAGMMDFICVAILLLFVFHVKKSVEYNYGDIVVSAGFNVSLNWTLQPSSWPRAFFRIYNSLGNETAEYTGGTCDVLDHSSYSCNINKATDPMIVSLTIFSVAAIHSGNYTLVPLRGFKEIDTISSNLVVIDGPDNITLSRKESDFYLKEHDIFTIDCSANCYPGCIFWWEGHGFFEGKKINISFESRMAGQYTCYVMNPQTNSTSNSNSITLHHEEKEDNHKEEVMRVFGIGLAAAVVLLVVVGSVLFMKWRKYISNKTDSRELCQACERQTESKKLERSKSLPHVPTTHGRVSRMTQRFDSPNNSREDIVDLNLHDAYNMIDDDALTDEGFGIKNVIYENSHEARRSTERIFYDYARSIEICHVERRDVHVTNETYITPISDRGEEAYKNETDGNCLTPITM